jgi:uncharacterized membrane protein
MTRRTVLLILTGIIVIAAGLRLYGLDRQSLWYDEFAEESGFQRQFSIKTEEVKPDTPETEVLKPYTPPLNLFFIYPVTQMFPGSDFALRMVPLIFGLISVPLLFLLGKRMFNEKVGLTASFLLAISPFHIWYSQDARMYALQWMLALVSIIFFLRMLERPGRGNYIGYVISTTAGLYTHQVALFLLALQGLYVLIFHRKYKQNLFKFLGVFCVNAILYLPWIIYSLTSLSDKQAGIPKKIGLNVILYTVYSYCAGFSIGPSLKELHLIQSMAIIKPYFHVIVPLMIVYFTLFVLGLLSSRKDRSQLLLLLLIMIMPIAGLLILNTIIPNIAYNVRYTGTALFGFLLLIAKGLEYPGCLKSKISGRIFMVSALIVITVFSAYSYSNYQFDKKYHKADLRDATNYINKEVAINDSVLCLIDAGVIDRYAKGGFRCSKFYIAKADDKESLDEMMRKVTAEKTRLWLVLSNEWYIDSIVNVKDWLDNNYKEIKYLRKELSEFTNVRVFCYDLTKKKTP